MRNWIWTERNNLAMILFAFLFIAMIFWLFSLPNYTNSQEFESFLSVCQQAEIAQADCLVAWGAQ